jgi:LmbE family N-acetylglucosaminyl deacetylase
MSLRRHLVVEVPARATAVYAHPDDPDVSCGGTLATWSAAGCEVELLICAAGEKGTSDPAVDPAELAERRRRETLASADVLGVARTRFLGHPDGEVANGPCLRGELVAALRASRPDVLVCPDPLAVFFGDHYYNHRDHREVGFAALDAALEAAMPLYHPGAGAAHRVQAVYLSGTLEPSAWVDISSTVDLKADAVACHRSQLGETAEWLRTVVRERADEAGREAGVPYAESFRRLALG